MRTFVAVEVPPVSARPGRNETHLTLKFLGEIDPARVPSLAGALREALRGVPAFSVTLEGVGAFPSSERPRVVWAGLTEGRDGVVGLAARVEAAAESAGFPRESRPFAPHVTLLRVRGPRDLAAAHRLLGELDGQRFGTSVVSEVVLYKSELRPEGPIHRALERFPLDAPA